MSVRFGVELTIETLSMQIVIDGKQQLRILQLQPPVTIPVVMGSPPPDMHKAMNWLGDDGEESEMPTKVLAIDSTDAVAKLKLLHGSQFQMPMEVSFLASTLWHVLVAEMFYRRHELILPGPGVPRAEG